MTLYNVSLATPLTATHIPAFTPSITKKDRRKPNILKVIITSGNNVVIGDEVKFYDLDNNYTFGGYVQKPTDSTGIQILEVADYSIILSQISINEVFDVGDSYAEIIEYLIDTYTNLSFVNNLGFSTPVLTKPLIRRDVWVADVINELLNIINGSFITDKDKVFTLFQSSSNVNINDIINGIDGLVKPWVTDNNLKAEKVIVKGAVIDQRTPETLIGTGTEFFTTRIPENLEIIGFVQTTETITGDYEVFKTDKRIVFNSSQTDPEVSYTYQSQIRIEIGNGKTVTLEKKYIETKSEARSLAREYYARFKDGASNSKWLKSSNAIDDYNVGELIPVTDVINNKSGDYIIQEIKLEYPSKLYISVGEEVEDLFDWQKESIDRIKQLEEKNNNSDFISIDEYLIENLNINLSSELTKLQTVESTGEILFASETTLANDADLISDTGVDDDFALAYDYPPTRFVTDYLNPENWTIISTEDDFQLSTEDDFILIV